VPLPVTTFDQTAAHFAARSRRAADYLQRWRSEPDKAEAVVPFVEKAATRVAYSLTPLDIERVCRRTVHALGDVKKDIAMSVSSIVNKSISA
jgi:hypothetical protein